MSISEIRNMMPDAPGFPKSQQQPPPQQQAGEGTDNNPAVPSGKTTTKEKLLAEIDRRMSDSRAMQERSTTLHADADAAASRGDDALAQDLRFEASELDKKAASLLKVAERLQRGWVQGGAAGAGIGAGIAGGLGMTVGALVTGVVSIPTTGLGLLVGAGTGLVHGPWVKFTEQFTGEDEKEIERRAQEEVEGMMGSV